MPTCKIQVPKGTGDIYANIVRQVAIRGYKSWQIAGYNVGEKSVMLGFKDNIYFNQLDLISGTLNIKHTPSNATDFCVEEFTEDSTEETSTYSSQHFIITNLPRGIGKFEAVLVYASGLRCVQENTELIKENVYDASNYVVVSSRHSESAKIAFSIDENVDYDIVTFFNDINEITRAINVLKETISMISIEEG